MVPQLHKQSGPTSQSCSTVPHSSTSAHGTVFLIASSLARKSGRARECLTVVSTIRFDSLRSADARSRWP